MISHELIRQYPFFSGLSYAQIITLAKAADEVIVEAGHYFFQEGDALKYFYMLLEGRVAIVIGVTDHSVEHKFSDQLTGRIKTKDVTVSIVDRRDFFGWSALIPPFQATAGARAITPCRVIVFNGEELLKGFQEDSQFGYLMTQKVAQIVRQRIHEMHIELLASIEGELNAINRLKLLRKELWGDEGMKTIDRILKTKGYYVWSIAPDASVYDAIKLMADKQIGALLVMDDGKLVGIISERDYARNIILKGRSSKDTPVREIMTRNVICTIPEKTADQCLALMTAKHIRHLPVFAGNQLVGVVSIGDLVKAIITEQKDLIRQLENYIIENVSIT